MDRDEVRFDRLLLPSGAELASSFGFDANGRLTDREDVVGWAGRHERSSFAFDAASRLSQAKTTAVPTGATLVDESYAYDALGNLRSRLDAVGSNDFVAIPTFADPDRLCRAVGPAYPMSSACHFTYDALGNVVRSPLPGADWYRHITYDNRGRMRLMEAVYAKQLLGAAATWTYDPFGGIATLDVVGSGAGDGRTEVHYGDAARLIEVAAPASGKVAIGKKAEVGGELEDPSPLFETSLLAGKGGLDLGGDVDTGTIGDTSGGAGGAAGPTATEDRFERIVPAEGVELRKRGSGAGAEYLYVFADARGTRVVTDRAGQPVQDLEYRPFGDVRSDSGTPGSVGYVSHQWNGGDFLRDFAVDVLGPRAYEPRLGRFLQRDPLVLPRTGGRANPYAFAWNDPVNGGDPSGLDTCLGGLCGAEIAGAIDAGADALGTWIAQQGDPWDRGSGGASVRTDIPPEWNDYDRWAKTREQAWDDFTRKAWGRQSRGDTYIGDAVGGLVPPGTRRMMMVQPSPVARQAACAPGRGGGECFRAQSEYLAERVNFGIGVDFDFIANWAAIAGIASGGEAADALGGAVKVGVRAVGKRVVKKTVKKIATSVATTHAPRKAARLTKAARVALEALPKAGSKVILGKKFFGLGDLRSLAGAVEAEVAMFTRQGKRLLIRGTEREVKADFDKLIREGWRWSGHTHPPGLDQLKPSSRLGQDLCVLQAFMKDKRQVRSAIVNAQGINVFNEQGAGWTIVGGKRTHNLPIR